MENKEQQIRERERKREREREGEEREREQLTFLIESRPVGRNFQRGFVRYGWGFGGRSRLPEALGYLVQNPAI